jgi:hypothetical protein
MSVNSPRQNYIAFSEWYRWAQTNLKALKKKKKVNPDPYGQNYKIEE